MLTKKKYIKFCFEAIHDSYKSSPIETLKVKMISKIIITKVLSKLLKE